MSVTSVKNEHIFASKLRFSYKIGNTRVSRLYI